MDNLPPNVFAFTLDAAIECSEVFDEGLNHLRLHQADGTIEAWSWTRPTPTAEQVLKGTISVIPMDTTEGSTHAVARIDLKADLDVFALIPDAFGRTEGVVYRCRDVADACSTPALRQFLSETFSVPKVFSSFWTSPASKDHHTFAGGLAEHSIGIAESIRDTPRLGATERDIGMAYALLHRIGQVWCSDPEAGHLNPLGHELVGLGKLHAPLERLMQSWPDGAIALRSLLAGRWKRQGKNPLLAVGGLVRSYDQSSATRDQLAQRRGHRRPWVPKLPTSGTVLSFSGAAAEHARMQVQESIIE